MCTPFSLLLLLTKLNNHIKLVIITCKRLLMMETSKCTTWYEKYRFTLNDRAISPRTQETINGLGRGIPVYVSAVLNGVKY